jgi:WD40 repeat protein/DNA-binding SARP family transcriptional activator
VEIGRYRLSGCRYQNGAGPVTAGYQRVGEGLTRRGERRMVNRCGVSQGAGVRVEVLGPLAVDGEIGRLSPRDRVVLAALVTHRGTVLTAEQLADALWGGSPPTSWAKVVQGCVARLRKVLGRGTIETVGAGYRLDVAASDVDAATFERSAERVRDLLALGDPHRAAHVAEQALALWRGRPLVDVEEWEPARREADRLQELRRDVEELRLTALVEAGRHDEVLAEGRSSVNEAPSRERRWALLATAQYLADRQAEALATLREARAVLVEGLGLDPGPDLLALEQRILRREQLLPRSPPLAELSAVCPYLGLVSYDEEDADWFFGRHRDVTACLSRLASTGVVAVVGPSGSGKSSLVRAGIAAALRRDGRRVVVVAPGAHPLDALTGLPDGGAAPVLVVDQCEEAVTLCPDPEEQAAFFDALVDHAVRAPLVVAIRGDRVGDLAAHAAFAGLVERGLHLLTPMTEADLRVAIEGPARQAGLLFEPGLVDLLLRDVEDEPGALPLLSHALRQTWLAREGRTLTVAGYAATGGIRGAVAQTAEEVYEQAPVEQQAMLRDLLLRLVVPSPEGEPVRSRVPTRMLAMDPDHERIVEQLVAARLVTSDDGCLQLAHEALTRAWPRLRGWLDDDVEGQRTLRHLAVAADTWDAMGRPDSELYRGVRLARAVDWRERASPDLTRTERAFLAASETQAEAEAQVARRGRRTLVGILAGAVLVSTVLASVAIAQARQARFQRDTALAAEGVVADETRRAEAEAERAAAEAARAEQTAAFARSRELVSQGFVALDVDASLAKLLALAAVEVAGEHTVDTLALLHRAYAADPVIARYAWPEPEGMIAAHLHPDGGQVLVAGTHVGPAPIAAVHDLIVAETRWSWQVDDPALGTAEARFSPDGEQALLGVVRRPDGEVDQGTRERVGVQVRSTRTGQLERTLDVGPCGGWVEGVSDTHVAVGSIADLPCDTNAMDQRVLLIDRSTGVWQELSPSTLGWAPMSGDGRFVAFTEVPSWTVVVVEVATGQRVLELDPRAPEHGFGDEDGSYWSVADVSADGALVVTGQWGRRAVVWDVATGQLVTTFAGHGGEALHTFTPDGRSVFSAGRDGGIWRWDARRGDLLDTYPAVGGGWAPAVVGDRLVVPTTDPRGVALLDTGLRPEVWHVDGCDGTYAWSLQAAAGVASWTDFCDDGDATAYVVDLDTGEVVLELPGHGAQHQALSPDGTRFVRQEEEPDASGVVITAPRIRDARSGGLLVELEGVCRWDPWGGLDDDGCEAYPDLPAPLWSWRFGWAPDADQVVAVRLGGAGGPGIMVWDAVSGQLLHHDTICEADDAVFADDGTELLVACRDGMVALATDDWTERARVEFVPSGDGHSPLDLIGWSADDRWLLAVGEASQGAHLHWFDAASLQPVHTIAGAHDGGPKSYDLSPDATLVAVGSSNGLVRVWDVDSREVVHEFPVGNTQVQGLAFVDDTHLAVATEHGGVSVYTLDPDELVEVVRGSLTRGFREAECDRYGFGQSCLTLAAAGSR